MNFRKLSRLLTILGAIVVTLGAAGFATADTPIGHNGKVGMHSLIDTAAHPGARCFYVDGAGGGDQDIDYIRIRPPQVFARDVTDGRDEQLVAWRAVIQRREQGSSNWVVDSISGLHDAPAWDDTPASFSPIELNVASHFGSKLRVRVRMFWYKNGGMPVGSATNEVDWYKKIYRSDEFGDDIATLHQRCADYYPG
jgi:hypothetical protein